MRKSYRAVGIFGIVIGSICAFICLILLIVSLSTNTFDASFIVFFIATVALFITSIRSIKMGNGKKQEPFVNPYIADLSPYDNDMIPEIHYPNLKLRPSEALLFASPANTFTSKEQVVGYSGGSRGMSVRLTKGLTYHTGGTRATPIRSDVLKFNAGDYIVTNERIVFIGLKDSFEIPVSKVTATKIYAQDAFILLAENKQKNIQIDSSQVKYALAMTILAAGITSDLT